MRIVLLAVAVAGTLLSAGAAQADQRCRQARLTFFNETGEPIRIFRFRYYDIEDQVMRTNDILNADIAAGGAVTVYETLEYVGNEAIGDVSVQFRIGPDGGRMWSDPNPASVTRCTTHESISHIVTLP
ncbi:MAG: hypothetical protein R3F55_18300 [Alphaproteobacteria bacterium]